MPATAPYSRVQSVNGNILTVLADEGAKFTAPFDALIWAVQMTPHARGVDSTEIKVTAVDGDNLTFIATDGFVIQPGLMIGVLSRETIYNVGDVIRINATFPNGSDLDAGTLHIRSPQGEAINVSGAALTIIGPGVYYYDFSPGEGGGWIVQWEDSAGSRSAEVDYFVSHDYL